MDRSNKPDISEANKRRLYNLLPTILTVMIVAVMIVAPKEDPWYGRVHDFQGLIGGFFAVLAAYVTIYQMRKSDERSDRRHLELLATSRLADSRRIERAVNPARNHLEEDFQTLIALQDDARSATDTAQYLRDIYDMLDQVCRSMLTTFSTPEFKAGMELFDGELAYFVHQTRSYVQQIVSFQENLREAELRHEYDVERLLVLLGESVMFHKLIIDGLDQIARDFDVTIHD